MDKTVENLPFKIYDINMNYIYKFKFYRTELSLLLLKENDG